MSIGQKPKEVDTMTDYAVILNETLGMSDNVTTVVDHHIILQEIMSFSDKVDFTWIVQLADSLLAMVGLK